MRMGRAPLPRSGYRKLDGRGAPESSRPHESPFYDEPGNQLLDIEQTIVREILDTLPVGEALDAACGTGRHAAYLASLGHKMIGVDTSPEMLARARGESAGRRVRRGRRA